VRGVFVVRVFVRVLRSGCRDARASLATSTTPRASARATWTTVASLVRPRRRVRRVRRVAATRAEESRGGGDDGVHAPARERRDG